MTTMKRRAAYSLVEMLVVMTTGTMVLGVAVGTITALLRTGEHSRRHVLERAAICRSWPASGKILTARWTPRLH